MYVSDKIPEPGEMIGPSARLQNGGAWVRVSEVKDGRVYFGGGAGGHLLTDIGNWVYVGLAWDAGPYCGRDESGHATEPATTERMMTISGFIVPIFYRYSELAVARPVGTMPPEGWSLMQIPHERETQTEDTLTFREQLRQFQILKFPRERTAYWRIRFMDYTVPDPEHAFFDLTFDKDDTVRHYNNNAAGSCWDCQATYAEPVSVERLREFMHGLWSATEPAKQGHGDPTQ